VILKSVEQIFKVVEISVGSYDMLEYVLNPIGVIIMHVILIHYALNQKKPGLLLDREN
jgi:hypothetical protein